MSKKEIARRLQALHKLRVLKARKNLIDFGLCMLDKYEPEWFHYLIADRLESAERGETPRLMIFMPPRHGKSELCSRMFPAWFLGKNGGKEIIAAAYSAELQASFGRDARDYVLSAEYKEIFPDAHLPKDASAKTDWEVHHVMGKKKRRSKYFGTSVAGSATGKGAHVFIIDDPVKDRAEANSKTIRDRAWDWYTSVAYTRLEEKSSAVVVIMTRWHEDDLAGRMIAKDNEALSDPNSERFLEGWDIISLPAIAEEDERFEIRNSDYQERLGAKFVGRKVGEPLYPKKFPVERYSQIRELDRGDYEALYQQRPSIEEGEIFKREWWHFYKKSDLPPDSILVLQSWDTASTRNETSDPSVGLTGVWDGRNLYLTRRVRGKFTYPDLKRTLLNEYETVKPHKVLVEYKSSGIDLVEDLKQTLLPITPIHVRGDSKLARALSATHLVESGRVRVPEGEPWVEEFIDELKKFPNAKNDDQVDAFSQMARYLLNLMADSVYGDDISQDNWFPSFRPPSNWPIIRSVNIPSNGDPFSVLWLAQAHGDTDLFGIKFPHNTTVVFAELYGTAEDFHPSFRGGSYSVSEILSYIRDVEKNFNMYPNHSFYFQETDEFGSFSQTNLTELVNAGELMIPFDPDHRLTAPFLKQILRDERKPLIITSNCKNLWRVLPFLKRDNTGAGVFARNQEISLVDCLMMGVSPMIRGEFATTQITKDNISEKQLNDIRFDNIFKESPDGGFLTPSFNRPTDGYDD